LTSIAAIQHIGTGPLNYTRVDRVAVQKSSGRDLTGTGSWPCLTFAFGGADYGTVVADCVITNYVLPDVSAGYANVYAFASAGATTYRNCRAYLPNGTGISSTGFYLGGAVDQLIDRCHVEGAYLGAYGNYYGSTNVSIQNSHFTNVGVGIYFASHSANPIDTVNIDHNVIDIWSSGGNGIDFYGVSGAAVRNIKITENTIRFVGNSHTGTSYAFTIPDGAGAFNNFTFLNNTVDAGMVTFPDRPGGGGVVDANNALYVLNRTLDGQMDPLINNAPANPSKLHIITTISDPVATDDSWVAVRLTSSSTITLPVTGIRYHHTITILNDQGTGTATLPVAAPSGGSIVPSSPTMPALQPNSFQRFMYVGSNTWQRN